MYVKVFHSYDVSSQQQYGQLLFVLFVHTLHEEKNMKWLEHTNINTITNTIPFEYYVCYCHG